MSKKPILKTVLIAIPIIIIIFCVVVSMQPEDFRVARSATFTTQPEAVFPHINELKKWDAWSPWAKLDPNAKIAFEGPEAGKDAVMSWDGNNEVGAGKMTIIDSRPNEMVQLRLDFYKPMAGTSTATFDFKPEGDKTVVTWSMEGKNNFLAKAFSLFVDCDKLMGGQFEKGLASIKSVVESKPAN